MALDEAFASAVGQALGELVTPETRTARKGELDKEIVGRARLWVVKFSVTKDESNDDRRELSVSVRIDRDKLRARLGELNVPTRDVAATTTTATNGTEPPPPPAKTVTVLVRVAQADGAKTSFGDGATADLPGVSALTNVLRTHGYAVRKAPTSGSTGRRDGDLPLSDDEAAAFAADAKADSFVVAGVSVADPVPVRGRTGTASLVTAKVRLVERKDEKTLGEGSGRAAAIGEPSISRALLAAFTDVLPPAPTKLGQASAFSGDDTPLTEAGVVLVRLPAKTSLALVLTEQKYLAGAKGVRGAVLRRMSPGGWVIGVSTSEPIEQVARIAKKAPSSDTRASVKVVGDIVEVALTGEAP
jgi:hypothetical protein